MDLTDDEQWDVLEPLIPTPPSSSGRQRSALARPEGHPKRHPLGFCALGHPAHDLLPERYPPYPRAASADSGSGYERACCSRSRVLEARWP
jgi:hypothetical protein